MAQTQTLTLTADVHTRTGPVLHLRTPAVSERASFASWDVPAGFLSDAELLAITRDPVDPHLSAMVEHPRVQNAVVNVGLGVELPLSYITQRTGYARYDPSTFAAMISCLRDGATKSTSLLFNSSRMVCVGTKTQEGARYMCHQNRLLMARHGLKLGFSRFRVNNRVVSGDVHHRVSVAKLQAMEQQDTTWMPERFPGARLQMHNPKGTVLVFDSGKFIIMGFQKPEDAYILYEQLYPKLNALRDDTPEDTTQSKYNARIQRKIECLLLKALENVNKDADVALDLDSIVTQALADAGGKAANTTTSTTSGSYSTSSGSDDGEGGKKRKRAPAKRKTGGGASKKTKKTDVQ